MPSILRKRNRIYHYDSNTRNPRIRLSLKTSNYQVALREKRKLDALYATPGPWERPRYSAPVGRAVLAHIGWLEATKTPQWAARQAVSLRRFAEWNKKTYLHEITSRDIEQYVIFRVRGGIRPLTIKWELGFLKRLWSRAVRDGMADSNVVAQVSPPQNTDPKEVRPFTRDEVMAILADQKARGKPRYPVLATMYYTGLRVGDVLAMQVAEFDLETGLYARKISKTGRTMRIPLSLPLCAILSDYLPENGPAFPRYYPENDQRQNTIRRNMLRALKTILKRLGIPDASLHSFRHAFNQQLLNMGLSLEDRQVLLGHSAGRTTKIYTHPNEDLARQYLDQL